MACVNLWEVMTDVRGKDRPTSHQAEQVQALADKAHGFASELSLQVDEYGKWVVELFTHDGDHGRVTLKVDRHGNVSVTRRRINGDIADERTITF